MSLSRPSLARRLVLGMLGAVFVTAATVSLAVFGIQNRDLQQRVLDRQNANLRVAAEFMAERVPQAEIAIRDGAVERLALPAVPDLADHTFIDRVTRATGETATVFAWDAARSDFVRVSTNIRLPDGSRAVGTLLGRDGAVFPVVRAGGTFLGEATILGVDYYTAYEPIFGPAGDVIGILYVGVLKDKLVAALGDMAVALIVVGLSALILVGAAAALFARRIGARLGGMADAIGGLAAGDTAVAVPGKGRRDEIGRIAEALEVFRAGLIERTRLAEESEARRRQDAERAEALGAASQRFRDAVGRVLATLSGDAAAMQSAAGDLAQTSRDSAGRAGTVSSAAENAAGAVSTVAGAVEELSASVREITREMERAAAISADAEASGAEARDRTAALADTIGGISEVVDMITDIAGAGPTCWAQRTTRGGPRAGGGRQGPFAVGLEVQVAGVPDAPSLPRRSAPQSGEVIAIVDRLSEGRSAECWKIKPDGKSDDRAVGFQRRLRPGRRARTEGDHRAPVDAAQAVRRRLRQYRRGVPKRLAAVHSGRPAPSADHGGRGQRGERGVRAGGPDLSRRGRAGAETANPWQPRADGCEPWDVHRLRPLPRGPRDAPGASYRPAPTGGRSGVTAAHRPVLRSGSKSLGPGGVSFGFDFRPLGMSADSDAVDGALRIRPRRRC